MFGILSPGFSIKTVLDIGCLLPELLLLSRPDLFRYKKEKQGSVK